MTPQLAGGVTPLSKSLMNDVLIGSRQDAIGVASVMKRL